MRIFDCETSCQLIRLNNDLWLFNRQFSTTTFSYCQICTTSFFLSFLNFFRTHSPYLWSTTLRSLRSLFDTILSFVASAKTIFALSECLRIEHWTLFHFVLLPIATGATLNCLLVFPRDCFHVSITFSVFLFLSKFLSPQVHSPVPVPPCSLLSPSSLVTHRLTWSLV